MSLVADVMLITTLIIASYLYGEGWMRSRRSPGGGPIRVAHASSFALGVATIGLALLGPIHGWSERSLAGHMTQHLMLLVGPLLFVTARTATGLSLGLAPPFRGRVARVLKTWRGDKLRKVTSRPIALALLVLTVAVWHLPALFDLTLRSDFTHAVEHLSFVTVAVIYWHSLIGNARRRATRRGPALLSVFAAMLAGTAFGALLTFARTPWYPAHSRLATAAGLDWLADQQVAGLVMWVPASIVLLTVFFWLAGTWLSALEQDDTIEAGVSP